MARQEILIKRDALPTKKPAGKGRRIALFSDVEDQEKRLQMVAQLWSKRLERQETQPDNKYVRLDDSLLEENNRRSKKILAKRARSAQEALELVTSQALGPLIMEGDETQFAIALSRVRKTDRPAAYQAVVEACLDTELLMQKTKGSPVVGGIIGPALKKLVDLDDTQGHMLSRNAIKGIEEMDPNMFPVAISNLPANRISLIADEAILGACSPRQLSTLIGMAAGRIFVEGGNPSSQSEARAERQQRMKVSLGRLLDTVMERDASAASLDDHDFGFAESVAEQIAAGQLARLAEGKPPTFTVCKLVELADKKRESAMALTDLLDPKIVEAAREVIATYARDHNLLDDQIPETSALDYFSLH